MRARRLLLLFAAAMAAVAVLVLALSSPASAQVADRCLAVSEAPSRVRPASFRLAALQSSEARLTFVGHATWLIESAGGISVATDYNDYIRPSVVPDIATMNRAHSSHYAMVPDPRIK